MAGGGRGGGGWFGWGSGWVGFHTCPACRVAIGGTGKLDLQDIRDSFAASKTASLLSPLHHHSPVPTWERWREGLLPYTS